MHENEKTLELYKRYFPISFKSNRASEMDSELYAHKPQISCKICRVNLLEDMSGKVISLVENEPKVRDGVADWDYPIAKIKDIVFSCEGCVNELIDSVDRKFLDWPFKIQKTNIANYTNPKFFIYNLMQETNFIRTYANRYNDSSYRIWLKLNRAMFYFVSRSVSKPPVNSMRSFFEKYEL